MIPCLRQVSIVTNAEAEETVCARLEELFQQTPSIYTDVATGLSTVTVYQDLPAPQVAGARTRLRDALRLLKNEGLDASPGRIRIRIVPPQDWSESWKRHFKPIEVSPALLVKPTWSRRKPKRGQSVVILDPGLSFGTGQHATTLFCLEQVAACRSTASTQSFLDIGTGSGILVIAAAKLGYSPLAAFDFDPACVRISNSNVELNEVSALVQPTLGDITAAIKRGAQRYDVVCANLIHDLLIEARDRILARVDASGSLVLAGILKTQFVAVEAAYSEVGWVLVKKKNEREWTSGLFRQIQSKRAKSPPT